MTTKRKTKPKASKRGHGTLGGLMKRDAQRVKRTKLRRKIAKGLVGFFRDVKSEIDSTRKPRDRKGKPGGPLGQAQKLQRGQKTKIPKGGGGGGGHAQEPNASRDWNTIGKDDRDEARRGFVEQHAGEFDEHGWPIDQDAEAEAAQSAEAEAASAEAGDAAAAEAGAV